MRLTLSGLFLLISSLISSSLLADPLGTIALTGRYDGPNIAACSGTNTCQASSSITIDPPYLGPMQMQATIDATDSFDGPTVSNPNNPGSSYGLDGKLIPVGSYLLNGSLNTLQGASFGLYSQQQNPEVRLDAAFNLPVNSGDFQVHAFFVEGGDSNQIPGDDLLISSTQGSYSLHNSYCFGPNSCNGGTTSADFTLLHTPGTSDVVNFYAYSSAWYTGIDSANFQVVMTGLGVPLSDAPEPATFALLGIPVSVVVLWRRRKLA